MNRMRNRTGWIWGGIALTTLAILTSAVTAAAAPSLARGALFVMTNEPSGNSILIFRILGNGRLMPAGSAATGGLGNGTTVDALQSQGGLVASGNLLFAVNAGSDEISV